MKHISASIYGFLHLFALWTRFRQQYDVETLDMWDSYSEIGKLIDTAA